MFELGQKKGLNLFLFDMCIRYGWVLDIACTFFVFLSFSSYLLILLNLRLFHCMSVFLFVLLSSFVYVCYFLQQLQQGGHLQGGQLVAPARSSLDWHRTKVGMEPPPPGVTLHICYF